VEEVRRGQVGPFEDLEVIRVEAGVSTARCCHLFDMPERTWRRWQAKARAGGQPKGPWPRPARHSATEVTLRHALAHPAWGHRKIWAMVRHDGHRVSEATVLRLLRNEGSHRDSRGLRADRAEPAHRRAGGGQQRPVEMHEGRRALTRATLTEQVRERSFVNLGCPGTACGSVSAFTRPCA
jgi:putative transposase